MIGLRSPSLFIYSILRAELMLQMKLYRGVVTGATVATIIITLSATFHLQNITTGYKGGPPCLECWNMSPDQAVAVFSSPLDRKNGTNLLEKATLSLTNNAAVPVPTQDEFPGQKSILVPDNCEQKNCREFLSDSELAEMKKCEESVRTRDHYMGEINDSDCKFLPKSDRLPVALISAQGSGNTWTRGLLEKATGICTGFIYCDSVMRAHGYVGERMKNGKVLVVKTHSPVPKWKGERHKNVTRADASYASAVFILRDPAKSVVAEWNRKLAEFAIGKSNYTIAQERHTYTVPREFFSKLNIRTLYCFVLL